MLGRTLSTAILASICLSGVSAAPSAGCGNNPTMTDGTYTTTVNGKQREYIVKLPDNYDNAQPYMLIFTLHALSGSAEQIANGDEGTLPYYGLPPLADNNAIFISPDGLNNGWGNQGGEDITFLDTIMEEVEADLLHRGGPPLLHGLQLRRGHVLLPRVLAPREGRAVAVLSGGFLSGCDGGNQPVAYYAQHGTFDSVLPVETGRQLRDTFVANNGCTPPGSEPAPGQGERRLRLSTRAARTGTL